MVKSVATLLKGGAFYLNYPAGRQPHGVTCRNSTFAAFPGEIGVILYRNHRLLVARLVGLREREVDRDMGVRWNRLHK